MLLASKQTKWLLFYQPLLLWCFESNLFSNTIYRFSAKFLKEIFEHSASFKNFREITKSDKNLSYVLTICHLKLDLIKQFITILDKKTLALKTSFLSCLLQNPKPGLRRDKNKSEYSVQRFTQEVHWDGESSTERLCRSGSGPKTLWCFLSAWRTTVKWVAGNPSKSTSLTLIVINSRRTFGPSAKS